MLIELQKLFFHVIHCVCHDKLLLCNSIFFWHRKYNLTVLKISFLHLPVTYFVKEVKVLLLAVLLDRIIELTTHPVSIVKINCFSWSINVCHNKTHDLLLWSCSQCESLLLLILVDWCFSSLTEFTLTEFPCAVKMIHQNHKSATTGNYQSFNSVANILPPIVYHSLKSPLGKLNRSNPPTSHRVR